MGEHSIFFLMNEYITEELHVLYCKMVVMMNVQTYFMDLKALQDNTTR